MCEHKTSLGQVVKVESCVLLTVMFDAGMKGGHDLDNSAYEPVAVTDQRAPEAKDTTDCEQEKQDEAPQMVTVKDMVSS